MCSNNMGMEKWEFEPTRKSKDKCKLEQCFGWHLGTGLRSHAYIREQRAGQMHHLDLVLLARHYLVATATSWHCHPREGPRDKVRTPSPPLLSHEHHSLKQRSSPDCTAA